MSLLKRELKTFIFIIMATGISLLFLTPRSYKIDSRAFSVLPQPIPPTPTTTNIEPNKDLTIDSPDGTWSLIMRVRPNKDYVSYIFYTSAKSLSTKQIIFQKEEVLSQNLSIPYNTWSPDNTYVFLKESTPSITNYLVFSASGHNFPDSAQYLNIQALFTQKLPGFQILDVTGWAAPNLLIVNTKNLQADTKVSFWFDVTSQSFIQLGTYFN